MSSPRLLQRLSLRRAASVTHRLSPIGLRSQHDSHGPHKEYFQTPGQYPKSDLSPYDRSKAPAPTPLPNHAKNPIGEAPVGGRGRRILLGATLAILANILGVASGVALITWEYLSPPFEPGSDAELELLEEIEEMLETHPLVEELREANWTEKAAFTPSPHGQPGVKGQHMLHQVLVGSQGLSMRLFHHPTRECTIVVFFLGFGMEGWPDVIHGGIITSLLAESVSKHLEHYWSDGSLLPGRSLNVQFRKPVKPGMVYSILVPPAAREQGQLQNLDVTKLKLVSLFVDLEAAPSISSEIDPRTNTETHRIDLASRGDTDQTHAIGNIDVSLTSQYITTENVQALALPKTQKKDRET